MLYLDAQTWKVRTIRVILKKILSTKQLANLLKTVRRLRISLLTLSLVQNWTQTSVIEMKDSSRRDSTPLRVSFICFLCGPALCITTFTGCQKTQLFRMRMSFPGRGATWKLKATLVKWRHSPNNTQRRPDVFLSTSHGVTSTPQRP